MIKKNLLDFLRTSTIIKLGERVDLQQSAVILQEHIVQFHEQMCCCLFVAVRETNAFSKIDGSLQIKTLKKIEVENT